MAEEQCGGQHGLQMIAVLGDKALLSFGEKHSSIPQVSCMLWNIHSRFSLMLLNRHEDPVLREAAAVRAAGFLDSPMCGPLPQQTHAPARRRAAAAREAAAGRRACVSTQ